MFYPEQRQDKQKASQKLRPPSAKTKLPTTYKDWQVKEEGQHAKKQNASQYASAGSKSAHHSSMRTTHKPADRVNPQAKAQNRDIRANAKSRSKSKGRSQSTESAQDIRQKVIRLTNNYMQTKEALNEEISEFEDSHAEPDRDTKARILVEQKARRRREVAEKKQREEEEARKKQGNMDALALRFKAEAGTFKKQLEAEKRSLERTDGSDTKLSRERKRANNAHQPGQKQRSRSPASNSNNTTQNAAQQMTDLRYWIEEQMKAEHMNRSTQETPSLQDNASVQNIEVGGSIIPPGPSISIKDQNEQERTKNSSGKNKSKSKEGKKAQGSQNQSILSNLTSEAMPKQKKDAVKTKMLKHQLPGNSMLSEKESAKLGARKNRYGVFNSDAIQSDFDKVVDIQKQKLHDHQKSQEAPTNLIFSHGDQARAKQDLAQALKGLGERTSLNFTDETPQSEDKKRAEANSNHLQISEEEDAHQYSMHSDDSTDKVPVRESSTNMAYRQKINKPIRDEEEIHDKLGAKIPGVVNTRSLVEEQEALKRQRDTKAALNIQKNIRGHWGRQDAKRQFSRNKARVEQEYLALDRELKSNTEYNMKQYLSEKKRIRAQAGLADSIPDEIAEVIGDSSSFKNEKFGHGAMNLQLQNFFKDNQKGKASDRDPLSLISIFAKRQGVTPQAEKQRGIPKIFAYEKRSSSKDRDRQGRDGRRYKKSPHRKDGHSASSAIEEEYSADFDESVPKSDSRSDSIKEESMVKARSSSSSVDVKKPKGLSSGKFGAREKTSGRRSGRHAKEESDSIAEDVIEEESNIAEDSVIGEDSIAQEISGDASSRKKQSDSLPEESIINEEYSQDNFEVYDANQSLAARNRVRFGIHSGSANAPPPPTTALEYKKQTEALSLIEGREMATLERKNMVSALLHEMKEYEKASISTTVVERMEKVVVQSLAQKDQIIMAARLAELEADKRHREEINRIREEQIQLMTKLMLLGAGPSGSQGGIPENQRAEILASIQKMADKPIEIKHETVNVNYSLSRDAQELVHGSGSHHKLSYLEEYERSKGRSNSGFQKYSDIIEEDIVLRSGQSRSNKKLTGSDSIDDIVDETSIVEESIREDFDISGSGNRFNKITQSDIYKNKAFDDFKTKGYKDARSDNNALAEFLTKMQKTISSERNQREDKLAKDLKKRVITPRSYDRKMKDVDKWVTNEKKEVQDKMRKIEGQRDVRGSYFDNIGTDPKHSNQIGVGRLSFNEDSADSDILREAIRQQKMLEQGLTGLNPDAKYLQKKKDAAQALIQQKEKAIQDGLKAKLENYQEDVAEELIQKALNLDVNEEIQRRYQVARRHIEESSQLGSARSNLTASQEKTAKQKKVQFASSVVDRQSESMRELGTAAPLDDDSIQESIQIAESISQSIRSQSATEQAKSRSMGSRSKEERYAMTSSAHKESRSEIDSDYSEDFDQSIASEKGLSKSMASSKQRLQSKAKDLEESNAYSENFEEETFGQSAQLRDQLTKEQRHKMDTVKEESIDESFVEHTGSDGTSPKDRYQNSISQSANEPESLPSEDIERPESPRSVDWKIQIAQDTKRSDDYDDNLVESSRQINEEIGDETSSDLNTRDEHGMADLDSCPDEISKSASKSAGDDIVLKADLIAEELILAIIEEYKDNQAFDLSATADQPDEDDFKKKFPWTLDKEPEKPAAPKPAGAVKPEELGKKQTKTEREMEDEKYKEKHAILKNQIEEQQDKVDDFLEFLCKRVDRQKLMESLNKPIEQDPLKILTQIQGYDDEDSMNPLSEDTMLAAQQQILPQSFFNKMDREYVINQRMKQRKIDAATAEISDDLTVSQEEGENIQNVHHYALFEALNEALDQERPYKNKGEPMPWSKNTRVVKQVTSLEHAKKILYKAKDQVTLWSKMRSGTNFAPLPDQPPVTQDELGEEIVPPTFAEGEEERRNICRQEKLAELMTSDIQENDGNWIDYEIQDTQSRFDIADMILHHLAGEIAEFLKNKAQEQ